MRITEANKHVSMLLPVSTHERSRRIENLNPNRNYFIQVLAFMGPDFQDEIYSSINVSVTTNEGGNVLTKDIKITFRIEQTAIYVRRSRGSANRPGGGGGDSNIKKVGMLVENFEIDPQGRPIWAWLAHFLTPKLNELKKNCCISSRATPKRDLEGLKYW